MKKWLVFICLAFVFIKVHSQYTNGVTGLLHMPNAEMQQDGTFMMDGNYLDKHNVPNMARWE